MYKFKDMGRKIKHDYSKIYQQHLAGKTLFRISEEFSVPLSSIYAHMEKIGAAYNQNIPIRHKGYYVDDSFLDSIDTEGKAYFLGWMFSDGNVNKNRFFLKLKESDTAIIREVFNLFCSGYKVSTSKENQSKTMTISSKRITNRLKELGCVPNKTEAGFNLPDIPNNLFRHFLRGYFDGDGSIGKRTARPNQVQVSICSIDRSFLEQVKNKLLEFNINSRISEERRNGRPYMVPRGKVILNAKNMYRLHITSHTENLKFYELLYKNCSIKLERKHVLYSEYYANTVLILESKDSRTVQRIGDETLINYDLIEKNTFYSSKEVDRDLVLSLYKGGKTEFAIHKDTGIGRCAIKNILVKENIILPRVPDILRLG